MPSFPPLFGTMIACWKSAYLTPIANILSVGIIYRYNGRRQVSTLQCLQICLVGEEEWKASTLATSNKNSMVIRN